jgi:glycosyltransferase involved in cell wall biosynthesis
MDRNVDACARVSALVLTFNEEANIAACLESLQWASEVFVVDSFSTDSTVEIAESTGARVYQHAFENCAAQWNWALENLPFSSEWVLVVDADERIPKPLAREIIRIVSNPDQECSGFYLKRRLWFIGRWLRHGGLYPTWIMRLFKRSAGRFGRYGVSEHFILKGRAGYLQSPFEHCNDKPLSDWIQKHDRYAELEAREYVRGELATSRASSIAARFWGNQAERKQWIKLRLWNRLPLLVRPFLFFFRNYILKGGFLDGGEGFIYHVLWSFWARFLIDVKILEMRAKVGTAASGVVIQEHTRAEVADSTENLH